MTFSFVVTTSSWVTAWISRRIGPKISLTTIMARKSAKMKFARIATTAIVRSFRASERLSWRAWMMFCTLTVLNFSHSSRMVKKRSRTSSCRMAPASELPLL